jgi:hypothetical protein
MATIRPKRRIAKEILRGLKEVLAWKRGRKKLKTSNLKIRGK